MAEKYDINKIKKIQEERSRRLEERNPGELILNGLLSRDEVKDVVLIDTDDVYSAPQEWNFYKKLNDSQTYELLESIEKEGLLSPIIVWDISKRKFTEYDDEVDTYNFKGARYMVLAGHNRAKAYTLLYEQTKDSKYKRIPAFVYRGIDVEKAKYIIVASNYIQRVLSKEDRRKSISYMYRTLKRTSGWGSNPSQIIADQTGLSPSSVYDELKITDSLNEYFTQMYDDGKLSKVVALKLANVDMDLQDYMVSGYKDKITNDILKHINKSFKTTEMIDILFESESKEELIPYTTVDVPIKVPVFFKDDFIKMANKWVKKKVNDYKLQNIK